MQVQQNDMVASEVEKAQQSADEFREVMELLESLTIDNEEEDTLHELNFS